MAKSGNNEIIFLPTETGEWEKGENKHEVLIACANSTNIQYNEIKLHSKTQAE